MIASPRPMRYVLLDRISELAPPERASVCRTDGSRLLGVVRMTIEP